MTPRPFLSLCPPRLTALLVSGLLCTALPSLAAALDDITVDKDAIATPAKTEASMAVFAERGMRLVTIDAMQDGYPQFSSSVARKLLGIDRHPVLRTGRANRDLVEETLIQANRNGMAYLAWFGADLPSASAAPQHPLRVNKPDWLARDAAGAELLAEGQAWLNPLKPEVRQYFIALMEELAGDYDIDGIRLDDSLLLPPVALLQDAEARAQYTAATGKAPPASEADADWQAWRRAKADEQRDFYRQALQAKRPRLFVGTHADGDPVVPEGWRKRSLTLQPAPLFQPIAGENRWRILDLPRGRYRLVAFDGTGWEVVRDVEQRFTSAFDVRTYFFLSIRFSRAELVPDRRADMRRKPAQ